MPARKTKRKSPTQRSKKLLEETGYMVAIVEKWNRFAGVRQDAFGFGDLLAARPTVWGKDIALVQTTTASNFAARRAKILAIAAAKKWVQSGGKIILHGWREMRIDGRKRWMARTETITLEAFEGNNNGGESRAARHGRAAKAASRRQQKATRKAA